MWVGGELDDLDLLLGLDLGVEADAVGPLVLALVEAVPVVAGHAHHVALAQGDLVLGPVGARFNGKVSSRVLK